MTTRVATNHTELPVSVRESRRSRPSLPGKEGWTPAHDDHTPDAVAWRAAQALEKAEQAHEEISSLRGSVDKLNNTLTTVDKTIRSLMRGAWSIALPLIIMVLGGLGALAWRWVSTLHH